VAKFSGVLHDRRWLAMVERIYGWHFRHERYLRNEAPLARIAVLHSEQTAANYRGIADEDVHEDHVLGMYHALVESRMPFELVHEAFLDPDRLAPFKLLILADAAALSDAQCESIRRFVKGGGSLVATFASSLCDETGTSRQDFGLGDLFGVRFTARVEGPMQNSYLSLDADPKTGRRHEVLAGLDDAPRIINGVFRLDVAPVAEFPSPVTLIPTYPDLPMEDVYPRVAHTSTRELYLRELGASRIAYIPWDIDRTFWDVLSPDHGRLLTNVVRWALDEPSPVEVEGRPHRHQHLAPGQLDHRAPGELDEPDDDERTDSRNHSCRTAARAGAAAGRAVRARR
jgi:hypothetical protein